MKQIIFEKLTVKEEEKVRAGTEITPAASGCLENNPRITCPPWEPQV